MPAARYFVFVEFTDPVVRTALNSLRQALSGMKLHDSAHITVRGPYTKQPDAKLIEQWGEKLHGQGVFIADVGLFKTAKGYAVFLHAVSKIFNEIWWKPDFSGPQMRRMPHITIYESTNEKKAKAVMTFLKAEAIEIFTLGVVLTVYTSRQHSLLSEKEYLQVDRSRLPNERLLMKPGLDDRAMSLRSHLDDPTDNLTFQQQLL